MTLFKAVSLFLAALLAGGLNSVAGGGSFISFPALVFSGVLPIPANATSTVALWPGSVAAVGGYRKKLPRKMSLLLPLVGASLAGGVLGAVLLLRTPQGTFMRIVPYLFLAATLLFAFGKRLSIGSDGSPDGSRERQAAAIGLASVAQFGIAVYGGYFGGGIGILMLALLSALRFEDIHSMNGLKALLATAINGMAVITFVAARAIRWPEAIVMIAGAVCGGYGGSRTAHHVNPKLVRGFVIVIGLSMAAYFLWRK